MVLWNIGKLPTGKFAELKGNIFFQVCLPTGYIALWQKRFLPKCTICCRHRVKILTVAIVLQSGTTAPSASPDLLINFRATGATFSGIQVSRLELYNEKYKPFKGVKYISEAGKFIVRTA